MGLIREFRRDAILRVHLQDDSTVEGVFVRRRRDYLQMTSGRIEANGKLHDAEGTIHVPCRFIKIVQELG